MPASLSRRERRKHLQPAGESSAASGALAAASKPPPAEAKRQLNKPTTKSSKVDAVTLPAPAAGAWDEEEEEEEEEASANAPPPSKGADVPSEAPSGGQRVACTVFLGQLPYAADEAKIRRFLKDSGVIGGVRVRLLTDRESRRSRGMAFVELDSEGDVHTALRLHKAPMDGRRINVERTVGGGGNKGERQAKLAVLRAAAIIVPADPGQPAQRLCRIVEDCGARVVLCGAEASGAEGKQRLT